MMLDCRGYDFCLSFRFPVSRRAENRLVVRFASARGKIDLPRLTTENFGNLSAAIGQKRLCALSFPVQARRVSEKTFCRFAVCGERGRSHFRCRRVVGIYVHNAPLFPIIFIGIINPFRGIVKHFRKYSFIKSRQLFPADGFLFCRNSIFSVVCKRELS